MRTQAERIAGELLDAMVQASQPADLVRDFAVPLQGLMICEMLGVPYADRDKFREWVGAFSPPPR